VWLCGMYKAFGKGLGPVLLSTGPKPLRDAGGYASDVLAAINHAIIDDIVDVTGAPIYEDPVAIATFAA
jgi:hypothetical protein